MRRTTFAWLLALSMLLACCGCGAKPSQPDGQDSEPKETEAAATEAEQTPERTVPAEQETPDAPDAQPEQREEKTDYLALYAPVLDKAYALLADGADPEADIPDGLLGLMELVNYGEPGEHLYDVGYCIEDLSGDGVPELLIGMIPVEEYEIPIKPTLFAGYTLANGEAVRFLEGMGRSSYQWLGGGRFYHFGSGGAAYSAFGTYHLSPDGSELLCEEFYFTHETDETFTEIAVYHNTSGEWDVEKSEKTDMTPDAFWKRSEELDAQSTALVLTPFAMLEQDRSGSLVRAAWGGKVLSGMTDYEDVSAEGIDDTWKVVFLAQKDVKDFKVYSLTIKGVDANGHADYELSEVYEQDALTREHALVMPLEFPGDMPSNAFSYVDESGKTQLFSLGVSGRDGSLEILPLD